MTEPVLRRRILASQLETQTTPRGATERRTPPSALAPIRRVLAGLAAAHRARLRAEVARFAQTRDAARPELGHALSWRFGVPVR
ncbi:hypothetical protein ASG52_01980 [Methylobacterium sp. Leaf456]|uniref:hypothetical protein n=1 Tax=Methylobacterium sp. Leaf456 TaxID=1736382 RepID=UPI0006F6FACE|nr:hypothetical protein [Methylobacterium sp. Leaf456]KQT61669.1 hypothetical protein ASG52_01980 [Methylobacterium sp. Leaf456]